MSKEQVVSEQKAKIIADQDLALQVGLESVFDSAFSEGAASVPPPDADEQAKIDAAVQIQKDADQAVIDGLNAQVSKDVQDLSDAHAKADADLAAVNQALADMTAKDQVAESEVADIKAKVEQLQSSLDVFKGLLNS
jgi:hypothetical protein